MTPLELRAAAPYMKVAFAVVKSRSELEKHLQPGDILVTTNAPAHATGAAGALLNNTLRFGIRSVYGDAGHAAAYVGDGKTIEMAAKLHHYGLSNSLRGKDVTVMRPVGLTAEQRAEAAEFMKKTVALEKAVSQYASPGTLAKSLVEDFTGRKQYSDKTKEMLEQKRYTCSNIVANAYKQTADLDVRKHKALGSVSPMDFIESDKMKRIVTFHNPKRHDKEQRRDPALGGALAGFRKKVAEAPPVKSQRELESLLKPGDIIITSPVANTSDARRNPVNWAGEAAFKAVNKGLYGPTAQHAALYVGGGKAVEMRQRLQQVGVAAAVKNRDVQVMRPDVPGKVRALAAKKAIALQEALGGDATYASTPWQLKLLANDKIDKRLFANDADKEFEQKRIICSNLVAKVYAGDVDFAPGKPAGFVTPKDLYTSGSVKRVGSYLNRTRWDKEDREAS